MAIFVHFDLPADDPDRAKKFYSELFEWQFDSVPGMEYSFITTKDKNGNVGLAGGSGKRGAPDQQIMNYIGVDSVDDYASKVVKAGGKVIGDKMTVPGWGYMIHCEDTEKNKFGLWQEDKEAK